MSSSPRIWKNAGTLAVAQAVTLGLNFALWVHLSRVLSPEGFGVLTFGTALLSYFVLAVTLGIDTVAAREIARDPGQAQRLVPTVLGVRLALAAAAGAVYAVVVVVLPNPPVVRVALGVLGVLLLARAVQVDWVYRGLDRMGVLAVWQAATAALSAAVALLAVRGPDDLAVGALAVAGAPLVLNLVLLLVYRRRLGRVRPSVRWRSWLPVLGPALPLAASAFAGSVYYNLDKVMLEGLRTTAEVGYYGVGYKVYGLAIAPTAVLLSAFFPSLAAAYGDAARQRAAATAYARAMLAVGLPAVVAGIFLAAPLIAILFGDAYAPAVPALRLLLANAGIVYVAMAHGNPLTAWSHERPYMRIVLGGAALNVVLNLLLIGPFGIVGAAGATLVTEAAVMVGMAALFRRVTGATHSAALLRTLPVVLVCGAVAWTAATRAWPIWVWGPLLVVVWAASVWAFRVVRLDELRGVRSSPPETSPVPS